MNITKIRRVMTNVLSTRSEILFGYLHGSVLHSKDPHDIDIAIFINPEYYTRLRTKGELSLGYAIPLELKLERILSIRTDLQILNEAPLPFRYKVISHGELIMDHSRHIRPDFECQTRVEYFDFKPKREEYLREAFS